MLWLRTSWQAVLLCSASGADRCQGAPYVLPVPVSLSRKVKRNVLELGVGFQANPVCPSLHCGQPGCSCVSTRMPCTLGEASLVRQQRVICGVSFVVCFWSDGSRTVLTSNRRGMHPHTDK
jgi:hypothetical protein